ncbi:MAG: MFS transporter [Deltaproteobacteria bacterium]|nr:MFS transporter [Deltaproteobacteria bacterium]
MHLKKIFGVTANGAGEAPDRNRGKAFSSLKNRNFRLLWIGGVLSHIGDEMQIVAVSWLVLLITDSPFLMGLAGLFQGLPRLFFGIIGGVIADRKNRQKLLIVYQGSEMFLALFFAFLVLAGKIQYWHILVLLPVFGFLKAVYVVCRQAYVFDLVGKEDLMNALALHSTGMNLAKIIGPSIAGILIGIWGGGWCLFINGLSFIAILISLLLMRPPESSKREVYSRGIIRELAKTFAYIKGDAPLLLLIAASFSFLTFGLQAQVILPLFARYVLNVGAEGYGFLMAAMGGGAVLGGMIIAGLGDFKGKGRFFLLTFLAYGALLILFAASSWFLLSITLIFLVGVMEMFSRTINQTLVQLLAPDELRGKILGIYLLDRGLRPLGGFVMGAGAGLLGAPIALSLGAGICIFIALSLLLKAPQIREL